MLLLRFAKNSLIQHDTTVDRKNPAPVEVGTSSLFHIIMYHPFSAWRRTTSAPSTV